MPKYANEEYHDIAEEIDKLGLARTDREIDFIEDILSQSGNGRLTDPQCDWIDRIYERRR